MKKEYISPIDAIILKGIGLEVQKKGMHGKIQKRRWVNREREWWIIEEEGPGGEKTPNPFDRGLMQWKVQEAVPRSMDPWTVPSEKPAERLEGNARLDPLLRPGPAGGEMGQRMTASV